MSYPTRGKWNGKRPVYQKPEQKPFVAPTFTPSVYQSAIVDFIRNQDGSAIVDAVAGSGKTSTLALIVAAILDMKRSYVVVAFNKSIAKELGDRGMNGKTFHSIGYMAVRNLMKERNGVDLANNLMDASKVSRIVDELYGDAAQGFGSALARLVSLAKNHEMKPATLTDDDIGYLVGHFDIDWDDENVSDERMADMVRETLEASIADRQIDFDDQLYYVSLFGLRLPTFDYILVDESQDTNPLRRSLVKRMMHSTSRVVAVGDERQAIYGFTGASHDSMDLIAKQFGCIRFPLSVSYRCPTSVVSLAQTIVPHIESRPGAPEGTVQSPATFSRSAFLPTDLVICRNTAPLVSVAYKLLAARMPCRIMGREIGKSLTSLIKKLTRKSETLETLTDRLMAHAASETEKAMKRRQETKAQAVQDKVEAIISIIDGMTPEDADGGITRLVAIIDKIFDDADRKDENGRPKPVTTLATVHKAKGLEAPRVVILDRHLMPSKMARQDWQQVQEANLMYVAYTRSLDTLMFVDTETMTD